jgi:RNA polymerase sigma-70 factor, ECF subfamily
MTAAIAELWFAVSDGDDDRATAWGRDRLGDTAGRASEDAWVARLRADDVAAFTEIYVTYVPRLATYAYSYVRDAVIAEELVHDVLASVWEGRARLQVHASFAAYLYGAVRFAALKLARDTSVRDRYVSVAMGEDARQVVEAHDVDDEARVWERRRAAILGAVDQLPSRCREAFLLRWRDELSYADIASVMGISVKTVEMQMTAAVKRLRARLAGVQLD